ncbi:hypothetical protein JCM19236_6631 [Vibrio sp. JCM 19236]|nr:hypothetical protein JCM19236_6631 [Vibrio sp. JCM 19236]
MISGEIIGIYNTLLHPKTVVVALLQLSELEISGSLFASSLNIGKA